MQSVYGIIIIVLGVIGNGLSVFTVYHYKTMRTSTKILFGFLSISDTIVLLSPAMLAWLHLAFGRNSLTGYSTAECILGFFIGKWSQSLSMWILVLISFERFLSVWFPTKITPFNHVKGTTLVAVLTALSITIAYSYVFTMKQKGNTCIVSFTFIKYTDSVILDTLVRVFLPVVLTTSICCLVMLRLTKQLNKVGDKNNEITSSASANDRRALNATKMMLGASIFQFVVVTPSGIVLLVINNVRVFDNFNSFVMFYRCFEILLATNNAVNFYIYISISLGFRQAFVRKACRCVTQESDNSDSLRSANFQTNKN